MSLMINSSGSNIAATATVGTKTAEIATATGVPFGQTLVQMLIATLGSEQVAGETAKGQQGQEVSKEATSVLTSEKKDEEDTTGLQDVLQSIGDLDALIAADPSLMAALQGWLQQVQQLLNPEASNSAENTGEVENQGAGVALPLIAQHADTIRFAVQDGLSQLLNKLTHPSLVGTSEDKVASQFEVSTSPITKEQISLGSVNSTDDLQLLTNVEGTKMISPKGDQVVSHLLRSLQKIISEAKGNPSSDDQSLTVNLGDVKSSKEVVSSISSVAVKTSKGNAPHLEATSSELKPAVNDSVVVTAGQLQMRDSGAFTTAKPTASAVPVDQFAKEMGGFVVSKLDILKLQGSTEARIILFPEHMGQVDVKITLQNGQLIAQFATEHASAKDSLEQQMNQLRTALQNQGIQVERLEVTQNQSLSSHMYFDGRQSGSGTGQQRQGTKQRNESTDDAIQTADMTEEWNEWVREVRAKEDSYGSSFVAKA